MPAKSIVWIKLYLNLLSDYEFNQLDDNEKWYFVGLLLLYPQCKNVIPYDKRWLGQRLKKDGTELGQELDKIIKVFGWRVKNGKIYIRNFKKYQHYKKLGTGIDQVYTKSMPDKDTEKEINKEKITTQQSDDVASQIHSIFKGTITAGKIKDLIRGKKPGKMLHLARYCNQNADRNPAGLFVTLVKDDADVPEPKWQKPKIPKPEGGYQTGEEPLCQEDDGLPKEKPEVDGAFLKKVHEDVLRIKKEIREKQKNLRLIP